MSQSTQIYPESGDLTTSTAVGSSITDLVKTREWVESQKIEYETELQAAKDENATRSDDPEKVKDSISNLQTDLQEAFTDDMLRNLMLSRLQYGENLVKHLFPNQQGAGDTGTNITPETAQQNSLMADLTQKHTLLVMEILKLHQENQNTLEELSKLKRNNIDLKHNVKELMYNLQKVTEANENRHKDAIQDETLQRAQEKLSKTKDKAELVRHLFQGLILGSGVNWARDSDLTELLLGLGQPLGSHLT